MINPGLALIVIGAVIAALVNWTLGILLLVIGVILLFVPWRGRY